MRTTAPLPPYLTFDGPSVEAFRKLPTERQKHFRSMAADALAAHVAAVYAEDEALEQHRTDRKTREAAEKAATARAYCDFVDGLNLETTAGRVQLFQSFGGAIAPLAENLQPLAGIIGNTDPRKTVQDMARHKINRFAVDLPLPAGNRGVVAFTGSPEVLDQLAARHSLPDTLEVSNPNGTRTRLYSHTHRSKRAGFHSPALTVSWKLIVTPETRFGAPVMDATLGHLPALPAALDGWLRLCGSGDEKTLFELLGYS